MTTLHFGRYSRALKWMFHSSQMERHVLKCIPQQKVYSTSVTSANTHYSFGQSTSVEDVNGQKKDKNSKTDFAVDLGQWLIQSSLAKGESQGCTISKRSLEMRVKRYVKQQHYSGKFHELLANVIATPEVLQLAYHSIRLSSNLLTSGGTEFSTVDDGGGNTLCFSSMARQLADGDFDVQSNTQKLLSRTTKCKPLVLPSLELKIVQEAVRLVLEVVYRPRFSKISHGCRNGRGQHSALKYIQNQIRNPDWWFRITIEKRLDALMFTKLVAIMKESIQDDSLYKLLHQMFEANVLNVEFGGFPKGQGCLEEGILSSVLMNIYLDIFDQEFYKISLQYEVLDQMSKHEHAVNLQNQMQHFSKLRQWLRSQMKQESQGTHSTSGNCLKIHACRYMEEIFVTVSGTKEIAVHLKDRILAFMENNLNLEMDHSKTILRNTASEGIHFLGMDIRSVSLSELHSSKKESLKIVHKLTDKVDMFSQQMKWNWESWTTRLGKKWLAHALKKIKEEDAGYPGVTEDLGEYRKPGMKPDHWFKEMLIIWIQDLDRQFENNASKKLWLQNVSGKDLLSELIIQPELPQDLTESYFRFQEKVEEYLTSELITMNSLKESLENFKHGTDDNQKEMRIVVDAPIISIMNRLIFLGLIDRKRNPQCLHALISEEDSLIINWYSGLAMRLINNFFGCRNFSIVKDIISKYLRHSCILTLAAKYRTSYTEILSRFVEELSVIPSLEETETGTPFKPATCDRTSFSNNLWLLKVNKSYRQSPRCSIACCSSQVTKVYSIYRNKKKCYSNFKDNICATGLVSLHGSLERKYIPMCVKHVKDLYLGKITLQDIDFKNVPFSKRL